VRGVTLKVKLALTDRAPHRGTLGPCSQPSVYSRFRQLPWSFFVGNAVDVVARERPDDIVARYQACYKVLDLATVLVVRHQPNANGGLSAASLFDEGTAQRQLGRCVDASSRQTTSDALPAGTHIGVSVNHDSQSSSVGDFRVGVDLFSYLVDTTHPLDLEVDRSDSFCVEMLDDVLIILALDQEQTRSGRALSSHGCR